MRTYSSLVRLVAVIILCGSAESASHQHQHVGFQQLFLGDTTTASRSPPVTAKRRRRDNPLKHFSRISPLNGVTSSPNTNNNNTNNNNNNHTTTIDNHQNLPQEKALQELKDRAQSTAQMETIKKIVDKIGQTLLLFPPPKKPRMSGTTTTTAVKKTTRSQTAKLLTKSSSPPKQMWTSSTTMTKAVTRTTTTSQGVGGIPKILLKSSSTTTPLLLPKHRRLFSKLTLSSKKKNYVSRMWNKMHFGTITPRFRPPSTKKTTSTLVKGVAAAAQSNSRGTTAQLIRQTMQRHRRTAAWKLTTARRKMVVRRVGRTLPLALPVVGGLFGLLAFQADYLRCQEEWDRHRTLQQQQQQQQLDTSSSQPQGIMKRTSTSTSSSRGQPSQASMIANAMRAFFLFVVAAVADYIDTLCQFLMAHTLWGHHDYTTLPSVGSNMAATASAPSFMTMENVSMVCALVSTVCAVVGELYSQQYRPKEEVE